MHRYKLAHILINIKSNSAPVLRSKVRQLIVNSCWSAGVLAARPFGIDNTLKVSLDAPATPYHCSFRSAFENLLKQLLIHWKINVSTANRKLPG